MRHKGEQRGRVVAMHVVARDGQSYSVAYTQTLKDEFDDDEQLDGGKLARASRVRLGWSRARH